MNARRSDLFKKKRFLFDQTGFTLIELLVALVLSIAVMTVIVAAHRMQLRSYLTQESMVDASQNARAAITIMAKEIRTAGYDPSGSADARVLIANQAEFQFQIDDNEDGDALDANEQIRYALNNDVDGDGVADGNPCNLGRELWSGGLQTIAENVSAINFVYLDDRINDNADNDGDGIVDEPDEAVMATPVQVSDMDDIRMVQITVVTQNGINVPPVNSYKEMNNNVYTNQIGQPVLAAPGDMFRRTRLSTSVWCRNLTFLKLYL